MKPAEQGSLWPEDVRSLRASAQAINMADEVVRLCDEWFEMHDLVTLAFTMKNGKAFYRLDDGDAEAPEAVSKALLRALKIP
jgi:hypothetical protein